MGWRGQYVALTTILRYEVRRILRIWSQTLVPPIITISLYFLIFGGFIGERIGQMDGRPYLEFIGPGLIILSIINNSYINVSSSFFSFKLQRSIEEMLVSPAHPLSILAGFVLGGVFRGCLVGLLAAMIVFFFARPTVHSIPLTIVVGVMTSLLFSLAGFINGAYARNFDDVSLVPTFVLMPLIYLGGVFYSIEVLPAFWLKVSLLNPILYLVNALRYGILGTADVPPTYAIGMTALLIIITTAFSLYLLRATGPLRQ